MKQISKRYLPLILIEILCLILLLPGCFQKNRPVDSFYGEDIMEMAIPVEDHLEFCGDRLELTPGVYSIRVQSRLADGETMSVEMKCEDSYYKTLRGNSVTVFSHNDDLTFSVWVLDKVHSAYVQCQFYNGGPESLVSLEVYRTNKGNRILFFLALVFFAALDVMLEFRRRILEGLVPKKQQVVFWVLVAGVLLAYFPYMTDYMLLGEDTMLHVNRIAGLKEILEHGHAVSMFYGDLFLFFPAVLHFIGFSLMTSYKLFVLALLTATAIIAYRAFYKCVKDEYAALFGSMFYLLIPYHIFNVYSRGAIGECLAMTFLPVVACGMYLLYTEDVKSTSYKKYKWYLIGGISAVLQSHLVSTEMTAVFMLVFCMIFWKKTFRRETFWQLAETAIIVLLVNIWFWLPLLHMNNADVYPVRRTVVETYNTHLQIGVGAFMLLAIYVLWRGQERAQEENRICKILAIFSILTIVMSARYLPWDAMTKISNICMVLATLFVALFAAFFFAEVKKAGGLLLKTALGVAAALMICAAVYHVNRIAFESEPVFLYESDNMDKISVGDGKYLSEGSKQWN